MTPAEMRNRANSAAAFLSEAINELGPITDVTRHAIREPILDFVDKLYDIQEELSNMEFDIYTKRGAFKRKPS